jgi:digeranylgeranylglycerophospholipid reductase
MDSSYDVVVVGAGPAGCLAATRAARNGARTLLLEKHEKIGLPVCCAEGITTLGLTRVIDPKPEWISTVIKAARIVGPSGTSVTIMHPEAGYVLHRDRFDNGLAEMARDAGVDVVTSAPVVGVNLAAQSQVASVVVDGNGSRHQIKGKVFVAADGVESRVAAMAGISTTLKLNALNSACQYLTGNIEIDEGIISIYIGNRIAPGGYAWVFPKSRNMANIGMAISPPKADGKTAKEYLHQFMGIHFPEHERLKEMMGVVPIFDSSIPLVKGNLMLVGDAGRLLDSLSGAGISNALISGSIAGEVAAMSLNNEVKLKDYPRQFWKLKLWELHAYRLFRSVFLKANDSEFDKIIKAIDEFFPEKEVRAVNIPDVIFKIILRNPTLISLAKYLVTQ